MEQAHPAIKPDSARLVRCTTSDQGGLDDTWSRDHSAHPLLALEQMAHSRRQCAGGSREPAEEDTIAAIETGAIQRSAMVGERPLNASMADYKDAPDKMLLAAARSGDGRAFVELSGRYKDSVHKRVFRILRNREDTEDVVQEALVKAYTHLGEFRGSCAFSTWLTRIAINSALMVLRKRRSHSEVSLDRGGDEDRTWEVWEFPDPNPNAEQVYARRQTIDLLSRAVKRLPSHYKGILEQYHGRDQSMQEAADTLGITVAAAKSRLFRARLTIRSTLVRKRISIANACY